MMFSNIHLDFTTFLKINGTSDFLTTTAITIFIKHNITTNPNMQHIPTFIVIPEIYPLIFSAVVLLGKTSILPLQSTYLLNEYDTLSAERTSPTSNVTGSAIFIRTVRIVGTSIVVYVIDSTFS